MLEVRDFAGREDLLETVNGLAGRFALVMVVSFGGQGEMLFLDFRVRGDLPLVDSGGLVLGDGIEENFGVVVGVEELLFRQFLLSYPRARGLTLFSACGRLGLEVDRLAIVVERLNLLRVEVEWGTSSERLGLLFSLFLLEVVDGRMVVEQVDIVGRDLLGKFLELLEVHYLDQGKAFRRSGFYAKRLGLSSLRLDGLCKEWFSGKGFAVVHRERLLSQAEYLLLGSDRSIKEIAYELNFCNQQHFRSYFVRNKGMSPLAFRRLHLLDGGGKGV